MLSSCFRKQEAKRAAISFDEEMDMSLSFRKTGSIFLWTAAAVICIIMLSGRTYAEPMSVSFSGSNGMVGPGFQYIDSTGNVSVIPEDERVLTEESTASGGAYAPAKPSISAASMDKNMEPVFGGSYEKAVKNADGTYTYNGKVYAKSDSWGVHKLTGYGPDGGTKTYSGKYASANHTVSAASDLPIGTVVIIEGVDGPGKSDYNGVYVVEDRGGAAVEGGIVDIFFDTEQKASAVTAAGWTTAEVWIAVPV